MCSSDKWSPFLRSHREFTNLLHLSTVDMISIKLWLDKKVSTVCSSSANCSHVVPPIIWWNFTDHNSKCCECMSWFWWFIWLDILWPYLNIWWLLWRTNDSSGGGICMFKATFIQLKNIQHFSQDVLYTCKFSFCSIMLAGW
jgi:hypothetical protein